MQTVSVLRKIPILFSQLKTVVNEVHSESGKSKAVIFSDILLCMLRYGASPNNYHYFQFYNLKNSERKTYTTNKTSEKMIKKFNNPADIHFSENKLTFAEKFASMYCRDFLNADTMSFADFENFCKDKDKFIIKPYGGAQGQDIRVFRLPSDNKNLKAVFDEIKEKHPEGFIIEEWICQHPDLSNIFPDAVNCLRVITVLDHSKVDIITGGVTFSLGAEIANGSQPSIVAPVDFEKGIISQSGASFFTPLYEKHPVTNAQIKGFKMPCWKETLALVEKAAKHVPTVGYVGWDIAITPEGPVLIEGNTTPGYKYYQIPAHLEDKKGNKDRYIKHL